MAAPNMFWITNDIDGGVKEGEQMQKVLMDPWA
jgi:hypothetical protein